MAATLHVSVRAARQGLKSAALVAYPMVITPPQVLLVFLAGTSGDSRSRVAVFVATSRMSGLSREQFVGSSARPPCTKR
jgi:hypothetical protein